MDLESKDLLRRYHLFDSLLKNRGTDLFEVFYNRKLVERNINNRFLHCQTKMKQKRLLDKLKIVAKDLSEVFHHLCLHNAIEMILNQGQNFNDLPLSQLEWHFEDFARVQHFHVNVSLPNRTDMMMVQNRDEIFATFKNPLQRSV